MINSKVYSLLLSLSKGELKKLFAFIDGNLIQSKNQTKQLFAYLRACILENKKPVKKEAFDFCHPKEVYNDGKLRLIMASCLKQLERYIVFSKIESKEFSNQKSLILQRFYREKHLNKLFKTEVLKFEKFNKRELIRDYNVLEEIYKHQFEVYEFNSMEKRKQSHNLFNLYEHSEVLYYARKMKLACYILSHSNVYQQEEKLNFEEIISEVEFKGLLIHPSIAAYYYGYQLLTSSENISLLDQFKLFIDSNFRHFSKEENRTLYFMAINNCIKNFNKGLVEYGKIGLGFYEIALKNDILNINGFLSRFTFRNIAMLAIRSGEISWAEDFTLKFQNTLRTKDKKSAVNLNLSMVYFYQGAFAKALEYIRDADFKDHLIHLSAKNLQCKIYFELKEHDALEFLIDSTQMYILRNKILGYHKESYQNTLKFFRKLNRLNTNDRNQILNFQSKINNQHALLEKNWLVDKLNSLL